jgi:multidrug efflux system membrane fusion protein
VAQGAGTLRADQAMVEAARLSLENAHIVSPIDGITGIRSVDPGNVVHASDTTGLVVVTQLDPIAVLITLPQDVLSQVAEQQSQGPLEVLVFNRDGTTELGRGRLEVIDNTINANTSTLRLKAVLPNPKHALWPNAFVKARLLLTTRRGALVVPTQALQRGPNGTFVYVMGPDQTVQPRPVTVDMQQGAQALSAKGVELGAAVVTEGQSQLRPGSKVAPGPSGNPRDGGSSESTGEGIGGSPRTP